MPYLAPRQTDPDLGPTRYCRRCQEWWPEDAEFWWTESGGKVRCRACRAETMAASRGRRRKLPGICVDCRAAVRWYAGAWRKPNGQLHRCLGLVG